MVDPAKDFEPGMFSIQELNWLSDNMRKPPVVAFDGFDPDNKATRGVHRARVEPFIESLFARQQLLEAKRKPWAGFEAVQDSIERFLAWHARSQEIARRGGPQHPSMYHWDTLGAPLKAAIGADSSEMVRTEILDDGSRRPFRVKLDLDPEMVLKDSLADVMPWVSSTSGPNAAVADEMAEEALSDSLACFRCFCGHAQEFDPREPAKRNAARGRMSTHMNKATTEQNRHRLLRSRTFR